MSDYSEYRKQPGEKVLLGFNILNDRPEGSTELVNVSTSTVTVKESSTGDDVPAMVEIDSIDRDITGLILQARIIGGTVSEKIYWIEFLAETTDGNTYERDVKLTIFDPAAAKD